MLVQFVGLQARPYVTRRNFQGLKGQLAFGQMADKPSNFHKTRPMAIQLEMNFDVHAAVHVERGCEPRKGRRTCGCLRPTCQPWMRKGTNLVALIMGVGAKAQRNATTGICWMRRAMCRSRDVEIELHLCTFYLVQSAGPGLQCLWRAQPSIWVRMKKGALKRAP